MYHSSSQNSIMKNKVARWPKCFLLLQMASSKLLDCFTMVFAWNGTEQCTSVITQVYVIVHVHLVCDLYTTNSTMCQTQCRSGSYCCLHFYLYIDLLYIACTICKGRYSSCWNLNSGTCTFLPCAYWCDHVPGLWRILHEPPPDQIWPASVVN